MHWNGAFVCIWCMRAPNWADGGVLLLQLEVLYARTVTLDGRA